MRFSSRLQCSSLLAAALALGVAADAHASIIAYDGFADGGGSDGRAGGATAYTTSPASTNGQNNDSLHTQSPISTGFADGSAWDADNGGVASSVYFQAQAGGLTYTDYAPNAAGQARFFRSGGSATSVKTAFRTATTSDTSDVQWMGLLVNFDTAPTNWFQDLRIELQYAGAFTTPSFGIRKSDGKAFFDANAGLSAQDIESAAALQPGTNLFLFRFDHEAAVDARYDDVTMWINPVLTADPNALTGGLAGVSIMRQHNGHADPTVPFTGLEINAGVAAGNQIIFDEFILTNDYADIFGGAADNGQEPAVPEPVSAMLAMLGESCLAFRRSRA